jgi:predicted RNA-binding Zn ribbon-like protein
MAAQHEPWPDDEESKPAPAPLRRIQSLVNTVERPDGRDRLADPSDARPWLIDNGFLGPSAHLLTEDLSLLVETREALRALLIHNAGGPAPASTLLAPLHRLAAAATLHTSLDPDGGVALGVDGTDMIGRLGELLLTIRDAQRDGTWGRLKACGNDECQWAFYDSSRNHGGTWCDMSTCGNKLKNRQFRARKRAGALRTGATQARRPPRPVR